MTIPSRIEAATLLLTLEPSPKLLRHCTVVAELAAFLAQRVAARDRTLDRRLVESAALLHDLDKALPETHALKSLGHGYAGAQWLIEAGRDELAPAVANHPVGRLTDPGYESWVADSTVEERIVAYADKRAAQRLGSLDQRFARWHRKQPEWKAQLTQARERAELLEREVCAMSGLKPDEVRRLRWVRPAIRGARGSGRGQ